MVVELPLQGRDLGSIRLPRWGRVVAADGVVPWLVVDPDGVAVEPVSVFLRDFVVRNRPGSVRSYAYDLLRWWRWLRVMNVEWNMATSNEVRELVLWLKQATKLRNSARTISATTAGTVNTITRKRHLGDGYEPATIRHSNAVLRSFYAFWIDAGHRPLVNPVPLAFVRSGRPNEHHNPMDSWRGEGRVRYNPRLPKRKPRAIPDERWNELFASMRTNRDRAIIAIAISNGARASELLGVRGVDLDWGEQLVRVTRKGTRAEQWLPTSADAFVWIRLYLADLGVPLRPNEPLWQTMRRRDRGDGLRRRPMNYEALRGVFRRANQMLGTNWSMHDLRHSAAIRMARDKRLSMRDVQTILGHAHLSMTADTYLVEDDEQVIRRVADHLAGRARDSEPIPKPLGVGYNDVDLSVLFGADA